MAWLTDGEKIFEEMFICFDRMYEHDGHTVRQTPYDDIGCACIASHSKNSKYKC